MISRFATRLFGIGVVAIGCVVWANAGRAQAAPNHPALHVALYELREARSELKAAAHDFGGHREKALIAVDAAIKQIDLALIGAGDNVKSFKAPDNNKKYAHHPYIHRAIEALVTARADLKSANHNFGGHKEQAIKDIDIAIVQLELALKFAKK